MPIRNGGEMERLKKPVTIKSRIFGLLKEVAAVSFVVLFVNSFMLASFQVPTSSMEETVQGGDYLFVNKFVYGGTTPYSIPLTGIRIPYLRAPALRQVRRGEVIVFDWPGQRDDAEKPEQTWYLKRCIALPGDTVQIDNRVVYVNGERIPDVPSVKFIRDSIRPRGLGHPGIFPPGAEYNEDNYGPLAVPRRGMSIPLAASDMEAWAVFIRREGHEPELAGDKILIDGKETLEYVVENDYVFVMGDSRDDSLDSRFWGFVPVENVVGTPWLVYWSWDPAIPLYNPVDKLSSVRIRRIGKTID